MNRHHDQCKSDKGQHLIGAGLQVQKFSPVSSRQEHGSVQAGMVQEELRVLHLHLNVTRKRMAPMWLGGPHCPSPQWHTSSNKATPPNSATLWVKHIPITTWTIHAFGTGFQLRFILLIFKLWVLLQVVNQRRQENWSCMKFMLKPGSYDVRWVNTNTQFFCVTRQTAFFF